MYYKFNETNNMTGYIKEMLKDFNLPIYKVYREDKPIYDGRFYIKDHGIYRGVGSGESASLKRVNSFMYNQRQINMTTKLLINSSVYDSYTHNYLGNYLRFVRDYKGINLMPLYNCFSNEVPTELYTSAKINDNYILDINTANNNYVYYVVPVKFNEEYTIAIDSPVPYELTCLIYTGADINDISYEIMSKTYMSVGGSTFDKPFIYSTDIDASKYWSFEKNLRLLIKLPSVVKSTITILEGNYLNSSQVCQNSYVGEVKLNEEFGSKLDIQPQKLSLLRINDKVSYPFADRLVEYLIRNAITPDEKLQYNIGRLQEAIYRKNKFKGKYDIWDTDLRLAIYKESNTLSTKNASYIIKDNNGKEVIKNSSKLRFCDIYDDLLSYGDKDVETFFGVARW